MSLRECKTDILTTVAIEHFGNLNGLLILQDVQFDDVGPISCVLARHQPLSLTIDDFVTIEPWNDHSGTSNEILASWGTTRYFTMPTREFRELTAYYDTADDRIKSGQVCNFVVFADAPYDASVVRSIGWSQLGQLRNTSTAKSCTEILGKQDFQSYLSQQLGELLLADMDRFVKRKKRAHQNFAATHFQRNGNRVD